VIERRRSLVLWFGVGAPPLAWAIQLFAGWMLDEARCGDGGMRWGIDDHLWEGIISGCAIAAAGAGVAAAASSLLAVRGGGGDARGRAAFLALTSVSAGLVFLFLTILTLVGVLWLEPCSG
jgi:hypothetical protein